MSGTSATVYRMFDAEDRLLYVGCSVQWPIRLAQHMEKPWWLDVARVTLAHFDDWKEALASEATAQVDENPVHNIVRNGRVPNMRGRIAEKNAKFWAAHAAKEA